MRIGEVLNECVRTQRRGIRSLSRPPAGDLGAWVFEHLGRLRTVSFEVDHLRVVPPYIAVHVVVVRL